MSNKRRASKAYNNNIYDLEQALLSNGRAHEEGPRRKTWSILDLKSIKPLTPAQREMFHDFMTGHHICAHGSAGTGKTYVAIYLALQEILKKETVADKIIIIRSAVPTRDIGHLPGTLDEKIAVYETPYRDMFADIVGRPNSYQDMKDAGIVQFITTSFIRGLTWDDTIIIIDEFQNMTLPEIDSVITRIGNNSRVILCGDINNYQCDLKREITCAGDIIKILGNMDEFSLVRFHKHDIVRSTFVKSWITSREDLKI